MVRLSDLPTIIVDTREQTPFAFDGLPTRRGTIPAGDYSLDGYTAQVAVERKSHGDCWGSMSTGRGRFQRCVERLAKLDRAAIVIECSLTHLCNRPHYIQRTTVASVIGGLVSYSAQFAIPIFWCDNRPMAERVTLRFLASWYKHRAAAFRSPEPIQLDEDGTAVF